MSFVRRSQSVKSPSSRPSGFCCWRRGTSVARTNDMKSETPNGRPVALRIASRLLMRKASAGENEDENGNGQILHRGGVRGAKAVTIGGARRRDNPAVGDFR